MINAGSPEGAYGVLDRPFAGANYPGFFAKPTHALTHPEINAQQ
jgi:hypothetical protein